MRPAGVVLLSAWLLGCSGSDNTDGGPEGGSCPNDLPMSCPAPAPSYQTTIAPLVQRRCVPCHGPGGVEAVRPLDSYNAIYAIRGTVLTQLYSCQMPPAGATPPTANERQQLLAWLVCQAPNN
jgi:hypothetical protein